MTIQAVDADTGAVLRTHALCEVCHALPNEPRRISDAEVRAVLAIEKSARVRPPELLAAIAEDLRGRALRFGEPLAPELQDFVDRHSRSAH